MVTGTLLHDFRQGTAHQDISVGKDLRGIIEVALRNESILAQIHTDRFDRKLRPRREWVTISAGLFGETVDYNQSWHHETFLQCGSCVLNARW